MAPLPVPKTWDKLILNILGAHRMDQQLQDKRKAQLTRLQPRIQQYLDQTGVKLPFNPESVTFQTDNYATLEIVDDYIVKLRWGVGESGRKVIQVEVVDDETGTPLRGKVELDQEPALTASRLRAACRS
jgi:hypothetical protein